MKKQDAFYGMHNFLYCSEAPTLDIYVHVVCRCSTYIAIMKPKYQILSMYKKKIGTA
jgi:hypothetical protein